MPESTEKRVVIIAHGDPDGLIAAAIIYAYEQRASILTAQPYSLPQTILAAQARRPDRIYVLDLPPENPARTISTAVETIWIDHHSSTARAAETLRSHSVKLVYVEQGCAATGAAALYAAREEPPKHLTELARIAEICDKAFQPKSDAEARKAEDLTLMLAEIRRDEQRKTQLVRRWARKGLTLSDEEKALADKARMKIEKLARKAMGSIIYESEATAVIDMRNTRIAGYAGLTASKLSDTLNKTVFLAFNPNPWQTVITCRAPSETPVNLPEILDKVSSTIGAAGGGHKKAAAIRFPQEKWEKAYRTLLENLSPQHSQHGKNTY